jgi:hypothetical protein
MTRASGQPQESQRPLSRHTTRGESSSAAMRLTNYHAKYFAHDLTRRAARGMD